MSNGKLLRQLIRSGADGDLDAFRGVAKQVIAGERQKQHHLLANDLETILYGRSQTPSSPALRNLTATIPEDRERGIPLLSVRGPARGLEDVVLSSENLSAVKEILREHNREEVLRAHGLRPSDRVLFCGPPGCGKTLTAEVIASELGRPLAIVRTDSVVSSFLGETAANLRKVFDFVAASPMVALFDEFDALGKEREDASERFAKHPDVAFTNIRAERDLRMSKVKQKVSGCFRTRKYAQAYCRISSYLQSMANQSYNPLVAIQIALAGRAVVRPNFDRFIST